VNHAVPGTLQNSTVLYCNCHCASAPSACDTQQKSFACLLSPKEESPSSKCQTSTVSRLRMSTLSFPLSKDLQIDWQRQMAQLRQFGLLSKFYGKTCHCQLIRHSCSLNALISTAMISRLHRCCVLRALAQWSGAGPVKPMVVWHR
jgi:hypothetical protein